jgi:flagellar assembly protein FliH
MVAVRKFLFDTEFLDEGAEAPEAEAAPPPEPTFTRAELDAAREAGSADGSKRALAEAATARERLAAEALETIGERLGALGEAQARALEDTRRGAVAIAAAIACKIAPEIARRHASEAVAALVAERLPDLLEEPRIVVRLAAAQLEAVKDRIESEAKRVGYAGRFILLAEDGLDAPDCRIEWADGGTERLMSRIAAEVDALIAHHLADANGNAID